MPIAQFLLEIACAADEGFLVAGVSLLSDLLVRLQEGHLLLQTGL
jgi:hypothetical protein